MVRVGEYEKKQPEYFCSYSARLTNFLKAFGLSYESRQINPITQTSYCVFKRSQKLMMWWSFGTSAGTTSVIMMRTGTAPIRRVTEHGRKTERL